MATRIPLKLFSSESCLRQKGFFEINFCALLESRELDILSFSTIDSYACFRLSHFESAWNRPYRCLSIFLVSFARRSGFHFFYVNHKVVVVAVVLFVITHGSTGRILNLDNVLRLYFICACPLLRSPLLPFCLLSIFTRSSDFILCEKTVVARAFVLVKGPPLR